jgi:hypothetical protein
MWNTQGNIPVLREEYRDMFRTLLHVTPSHEEVCVWEAALASGRWLSQSDGSGGNPNLVTLLEEVRDEVNPILVTCIGRIEFMRVVVVGKDTVLCVWVREMSGIGH